MTFVVTPEQMRSAEHRAIEAGSSDQELMRIAGEAIAGWIDDQFHSHGETRTVIGLVGPGKNGGDTLIALSLLAGLGWNASAVPVDRDAPGTLPVEGDLLDRVEIVRELSDLPDGLVIVLDGVFGLGGRPELPARAVKVFGHLNDGRMRPDVVVIAIDVPSGVDSASGEASNDALRAEATLSLGALKAGLLREPAATLAGAVVHIDIGLEFQEGQSSGQLLDQLTVVNALPDRPATAGKHDYGGLLVIGGAPTYFGAPRLAAEAGLLSGAGLVGAAVPRMLVSTIAVQVPELVFVPLSDNDARKSTRDITKALTGDGARYSAAVLGPGLGQDEAATALLDNLFGQATAARRSSSIGFGLRDGSETEDEGSGNSALGAVPLVLDADALNWLAGKEDRWSFLTHVTAVLTPHAGELARLCEVNTEEVKSDRLGYALNTAHASGQVVVLKGGYTVIAAPDGRFAYAQRATPELATPGTGDVLAGLIGGFLAQGMSPWDAACAGVYVGAEAGLMALQERSSRSVVARDLLANIGPALDKIEVSGW